MELTHTELTNLTELLASIEEQHECSTAEACDALIERLKELKKQSEV